MDDFFAVLGRIGHIPLPPYIDCPDTPEDREHYQTVYAKPPGSVAAPTAGLHFTPEILDRIRQRGIETAEITLHVGLGTFQPVRVEVVEEHKLHREWFEISPDTAEQIQRARDDGRRIVAVGTTTVRTLEFAAQQGLPPKQNQLGWGTRIPPPVPGCIPAQPGRADIFIYPSFRFRVVSALLTNFHLPESTLLMLVCGFGGKDRVLRAYEHAVRSGTGFILMGTACFWSESQLPAWRKSALGRWYC